MRPDNLSQRDRLGPESLAADGKLDLESRIQRLLADYLRAWGLRDPQVIAERCRIWSSECLAAIPAPERSTPAALHAAIALASREMESWLDQLAGQLARSGAELASRRGLLATQLQAVIDRYAPALLDEDLPAGLLEELRDAARPAVPVTCPTAMPPQPLGSVAPLLRWKWWTQPLRKWSRIVPRWRLSE